VEDIKAFIADHAGLTIREMADKLDIPKSTIWRLLNTGKGKSVPFTISKGVIEK
jgi:predicted DNA-binding protein (UPF0251 family)